MSNENNTGEKRGDAGGGAGKGNNRRRYFRRRKPAAKGQEPAGKQEAAPKQEPRRAKEPPAKNRTRSNAKAEVTGKNERDRRGGRRRRRRSRSERGEELPVVQESTVAVIDHEYTPPKSVFVYTYILRPGAPSLHEFRPEHFSRVGRRLEDFEIDLSPIFPVEGAAQKVAKPVMQMESDEDEDEDESADVADEFADELDEE